MVSGEEKKIKIFSRQCYLKEIGRYKMAFNKTKTDPELGLKVHEYLVRKGVETPQNENNLSRTDKIDEISRHMKYIMKTLGLDLEDDSLMDTPNRVAKMYVN